jgi:cytidine deaminase
MGNLTGADPETLIGQAREALSNAYSPYSLVRVGAALISAGGKIYTGCNVENLSYGLTNCAERTAVFKAVSEEGESFKIIAIAVVAERDSSPFAISPCGACRQVLLEFAQSSASQCFFIGKNGALVTRSIEDLLPEAFR